MKSDRTIWMVWLACAIWLSGSGAARGEEDDLAGKDRDEITQSMTASELAELFSPTTYIDNASVGTRLRLRLDYGTGIDKPDRAEFFYGKCGCFGGDAPGPIGTFVDADGNPVLDPNDADVNGSPLIENSLDYQELRLDLEHAVRDNLSWFVEVPVRWVDGQAIGRSSGPGDVRFGWKYALVTNPDRVLTLQLRTYIPSGDASKGLGTGHYSVEPGLLYLQRLSPNTTIAGELQYWHPINGSSSDGLPFSGGYAGDVLRYGLGISRDFYVAGETTLTPVIELVGWTVLGGIAANTSDRTPAGLTIEEADTTIVNLKASLRWNFNRTDSVAVSLGMALTSEVWYDRIVRVEYRSTQ